MVGRRRSHLCVLKKSLALPVDKRNVAERNQAGIARARRRNASLRAPVPVLRRLGAAVVRMAQEMGSFKDRTRH